jgi:hypothetical protein
MELAGSSDALISIFLKELLYRSQKLLIDFLLGEH